LGGGITPDEAAKFSRRLHELGFDYIHVSSGGVIDAMIPYRELGYQGAWLRRYGRRN
jgi:hypothetical protein